MLTHNLGYPRVGAQRQLKKACELYWDGKLTKSGLFDAAKSVEEAGWMAQCEASMDLIPISDFSLYDHVLDMVCLLGAIPERFSKLLLKMTPSLQREKNHTINDLAAMHPEKGFVAQSKQKALDDADNHFTEIDLYFAMARGYQKEGLDLTPLEMTKWFDTNYHYIVPEFKASQQFKLFYNNLLSTFLRATVVIKKGTPKPVMIGPISFLLLGKEKEEGFHRLDILDRLLPVYVEILKQLEDVGVRWVQLDEPYLGLDLDDRAKLLYPHAYKHIQRSVPRLNILVATYFNGTDPSVALNIPITALHLDLVRCPEQLEPFIQRMISVRHDDPDAPAAKLCLSLGVVDGRCIWKNDYEASLRLIKTAVEALGLKRVLLAPSCSLLHVPIDLELETLMEPNVKHWMAFAKQKLYEISELSDIVNRLGSVATSQMQDTNKKAIHSRQQSRLVHNPIVKERVLSISQAQCQRQDGFGVRQSIQRTRLQLPSFPTTTIGSFPQTAEIRQLRAQLKKGNLSGEQYEASIKKAIIDVIRWQEDVGLDVLVHGEFERNDMVEYFGELLEGFCFTQHGWVTSYGSRCVKPPIIYGDVNRMSDMTVKWSAFAQSQTSKPMKAMLTGPVTMLQWSFVRDDQPRSETAFQIALAIRDEVVALERAGLRIIQIDEPAIREGLPLRRQDWPEYLTWAVQAFKLSSSGVTNETQIHTHMCYSEFNDIIETIASMDADVITVENSRSQMELLKAFSNFKYPNEIGPGVYDIHSPRVPSSEEMFSLLEQAARLIDPASLWVNPDCGLKTRSWDQVKASLSHMVSAARRARQQLIVKKKK